MICAASFPLSAKSNRLAFRLTGVSGRPRGFGFIEMPSADDGKKAIAAMNGKMIKNRTLTVNEAEPRQEHGAGNYREGGRGSGYQSRR